MAFTITNTKHLRNEGNKNRNQIIHSVKLFQIFFKQTTGISNTVG